ncbi:1619_t:CDS:1 [Diversispora eburnea]|uniref:1619_t:CDS:1 n=1 Tax=Diversispora eburnea TaxID=1213867 RepID=A0A9N9BW98_9GLOM|nr:1619_t:CDS:1 [Diversispora eburnea]
MFINCLVEGKTPVKTLIDTESNIISKRLFDKLEEDYGLEGVSDDDLIGEEIKCLDLQFCYKGKWRSLDATEVIDFQIRKNPSFDLVLGQEWLWMHKAKISFEFSFEARSHHAKIEIDGMSIPLIEGGSKPTGDSLSHKVSSSKNNLSKSTESKPGLAQEGVMNIINKILLNIEDRFEESLLCNNKQRIFHNIPPVPPPSRRLNDDVPKNSRASKNKKYPKVDLGDGYGKLSLKTYLNNIWKSVHSIENDIEYGIFKKLRIIEYKLSCINKEKLP